MPGKGPKAPGDGELILLPKTIEYYRAELAGLLQREAYGEAIALLRFLSGCKTEDRRIGEEWRRLLEWLCAEFPEAAEDPAADADDEPELLARRVSDKAAQDKHFSGKLLNMLSPGMPVDRQLAALEQIAHLPADAAAGAAEELRRRLGDVRLHPFVSFKMLQTLARLGVRGEATFVRLGGIVTGDIEPPPARPGHFPEPLPAVGRRVAAAAEALDPQIGEFAEQTWEEFLTYVYGTSLYRELLRTEEEASLDAWACALHAAVEAALRGECRVEELLDRYAITAALRPSYERAYGAIAGFFREASGVLI